VSFILGKTEENSYINLEDSKSTWHFSDLMSSEFLDYFNRLILKNILLKNIILIYFKIKKKTNLKK